MQQQDNTAVRKWAALGGMYSHDGRALSNWASNKAVQLAEFTWPIRDVAVTAVAVTGTAEPFLYELVTVAPYVANLWKGAEFRSEVWSL